MADVLTIADIYAQFPDEWVLIDDPVTDEHLFVQAGRVLAHSQDRDEVYQQGVLLHPRRSAFLYTGTIPPDTEIVV